MEMDKDKLYVKDKHCGSQPGHIKIHNAMMRWLVGELSGKRQEWKVKAKIEYVTENNR